MRTGTKSALVSIANFSRCPKEAKWMERYEVKALIFLATLVGDGFILFLTHE
jgi:hypothetical protein